MNLTPFVEAVGADVKALKAKDGELERSLTGLQQTVSGLNQGAIINDTQTASQSTWSAQKISQAITKAVSDAKLAVKNELVNGSSQALDTLNELAVALNNDPNYAANVATALSKKLSLDAQTLTDTQKRQVFTNLGVPSDLLSVYNAAKA